MIGQVEKDSFWEVVEECLVEFHQLGRAEAHGQSNGLRVQMENPPTGMSNDIFYHAEPFDVACDITGNKLDLRRFRKRYDTLLDQHGW